MRNFYQHLFSSLITTLLSSPYTTHQIAGFPGRNFASIVICLASVFIIRSTSVYLASAEWFIIRKLPLET
ncbi:hypothetical protein F5B20DRAFT_531267 [Whalleya microplaca]|nr:hypothetical protein F5B20DRAFT_531267 [Whalleya microplaca]